MKETETLRMLTDAGLRKALTEVNTELRAHTIRMYKFDPKAGRMKRNLRKRKARILTLINERKREHR